MRRRLRVLSCLLACAFCLSTFDLAAAQAAASQTLARAEQAEFLRTAKIIAARQTSKGITLPFRLTLTDGKLTHDAHFQSIDERRTVSMGTGRGRKAELNFMDSWRFNVAAPRIAELLGIGDMVPVSVERSWQGKRGAMTWWVDDVLMDEEERRKNNVEPPDKDEWNRQNLRMRVFTELVYDTDRNQGNILITKDWRLVMIDFTRGFRGWNEPPSPLTILRRCDRSLLAAMRALTKPAVREAVGTALTTHEVDALLARRDVIVKHFDDLVARLGEGSVLY